MTNNLKTGILYLVGTPIGNLEDITLRAIRILNEVDAIAAEDTRRTGKLLKHLQINTPQISYHEHNHQYRVQNLLNRLLQGQNIAVVTDAGMPSICDPGYELVQAAIAARITVVPIPGCSAVIAAVAASGLSTEKFIFAGFLPLKDKERKAQLEELKYQTLTSIWYEAPHRLLKTLKDLEVVLGKDRKIVIARELTKIHEEFWRGTISQAVSLYNNRDRPKGEYTLVIAGAATEKMNLSEAELKLELKQLLQQGMTRSQASRQLAKSTVSKSRREIYQLALEVDF